VDNTKEIAQAIRATLGTGDTYTDTIVGAVFSGLREVAESNLEIAKALNDIAKAIEKGRV
jgi:hypothetical protein